MTNTLNVHNTNFSLVGFEESISVSGGQCGFWRSDTYISKSVASFVNRVGIVGQHQKTWLSTGSVSECA